jgi:hypothetical protein
VSPRGAHLLLKVRCAVMNGTLAHDHAVAENVPFGIMHDPQGFETISGKQSTKQPS